MQVRNRNLAQGPTRISPPTSNVSLYKEKGKGKEHVAVGDSSVHLKNMIIACLGCMVVVMFLMKNSSGAPAVGAPTSPNSVLNPSKPPRS